MFLSCNTNRSFDSAPYNQASTVTRLHSHRDLTHPQEAADGGECKHGKKKRQHCLLSWIDVRAPQERDRHQDYQDIEDDAVRCHGVESLVIRQTGSFYVWSPALLYWMALEEKNQDPDEMGDGAQSNNNPYKALVVGSGANHPQV